MREERRAELGRGKEERCCRDPVLHPSVSGCVTVNKLMSVSGIHQINAIMEARSLGLLGRRYLGMSANHLSLGATSFLYKAC